MITKCKISIIIPTYNAEPYIMKCFDSIKKQTFSDYEVIFIDDCSQDKTPECIHNFMKKNPHIICKFMANAQNMGDTYSRNIGFKIAQGTYVCTIDADDSFHSQYLELLYNKAKETNAEIVFCGYDRHRKNKIMTYTSTWKYPLHSNVFKLKYSFLTTQTHICHCTVLYNRSFLIQNNLKYIDGCRYAGDTEFVTKVLFCIKAFACVPQSLYYYNIHDNSISTKIPTSENFDGYYAYERAVASIKNPFWKILFLLTREAREVYHIIEAFYSKNMELPYLFCSKYKILFLLLINSFRKYKRDKDSIKIMLLFYNNYFKKA